MLSSRAEQRQGVSSLLRFPSFRTDDSMANVHSHSPRLTSWLLAGLLLVSFGLRVWDASHGLHAGRYFDERFTFKNVSQILEGDFRPRHAFYLSLSYLPQSAVMAASEGLHKLTGLQALSIYSEKAADGYSPTGYLLARGCNVLYGVFSLWLVFLIGRRIW